MELALIFLVGLVVADVVRLSASHGSRAEKDSLFVRPLPRAGRLA